MGGKVLPCVRLRVSISTLQSFFDFSSLFEAVKSTSCIPRLTLPEMYLKSDDKHGGCNVVLPRIARATFFS